MPTSTSRRPRTRRLPTRPARPAVRVRPMRSADVPAVAGIERETFGAEAWPAGAFAYLCQVFAVARPPRGRLWVAEASHRRVVGYTGIELSWLGGEADVVNLAVDRAYRRHGVGRRLLAAARAHCRRLGVPLLWLRVRAGNRGARAFYRRCGFRMVGRFRAYYDDPREDALLMALAPPPRPRADSGKRRRAGSQRKPRS